jgi:hypothetical protein
VQAFGVPDAKYGEELCAWIIARSGSAITDGRHPVLPRSPDLPLEDLSPHPLHQRHTRYHQRQGDQVGHAPDDDRRVLAL